MRIDIMTDIETLGLRNEATIFQISAIAFDIKTGEHLWTFNRVADIEENEEMVVDGGTLKWWLNTDADLLKSLLTKQGELSSEELVAEFRDWLNVISDYEPVNLFLWGNGILFDNAKLKLQMEALGLRYPVHYKNDRDLRTLVDLTTAKLGITEEELKMKYSDDNLIKHDAFDDCIYQINLAVGCYNELIK